jgi:hypothetical protein
VDSFSGILNRRWPWFIGHNGVSYVSCLSSVYPAEISIGGSTNATAALSGATPDAGGTVTYGYFTLSTCSGTLVSQLSAPVNATITAPYGGDNAHSISSGRSALTVTAGVNNSYEDLPPAVRDLAVTYTTSATLSRYVTIATHYGGDTIHESGEGTVSLT